MNLNSFIDYTLLRPEALRADVKLLCEVAQRERFAAVCVSPYFAGLAVDLLRNSGINVATVVGFPMGYAPIATKVDEVKRLVEEDVDEIDAVVNIAAVKNGNWKYVRNDIDSMTIATHWHGKKLKLIIETALLSPEETVTLCQLAAELGVDYVKTSTGLLGQGATPEIVAFLRQNLPKNIRIKASGGITTVLQAELLLAAGADRIGTSKLLL